MPAPRYVTSNCIRLQYYQEECISSESQKLVGLPGGRFLGIGGLCL